MIDELLKRPDVVALLATTGLFAFLVLCYVIVLTRQARMADRLVDAAGSREAAWAFIAMLEADADISMREVIQRADRYEARQREGQT